MLHPAGRAGLTIMAPTPPRNMKLLSTAATPA
jgi:hypothetical protein